MPNRITEKQVPRNVGFSLRLWALALGSKRHATRLALSAGCATTVELYSNQPPTLETPAQAQEEKVRGIEVELGFAEVIAHLEAIEVLIADTAH